MGGTATMFVVTSREMPMLFSRCDAVRLRSEMPKADAPRSDRNVLIE
ncbi:MAG TPA: hypothetical protein VMQ99_25365 [Acetobacteraceae bacterium]|nr:hypothetical protein [Acetobacteraceae bacterium]